MATLETTSLAIFIRRFRLPVAMIAGVGLFGVLGYMVLLGWSFRDAEFMTVITLSARAVRDDLTIVARATDLESIDRLYRAGANRVIQPYAVSGRMLAAVSVRPAVVDFMDLVSITPDLRLEELEVRQGGALDGLSVGDVATKYRGVTILAVRSGASTMMRAAPDPDVVLVAGDVVVALGPVAALGDVAR